MSKKKAERLYLVAEVLSGDAEDVQAQRGPVELSLETLELSGLFFTALTQLLDQRWVQLRGPLCQTGPGNPCSAPINYTHIHTG